MRVRFATTLAIILVLFGAGVIAISSLVCGENFITALVHAQTAEDEVEATHEFDFYYFHPGKEHAVSFGEAAPIDKDEAHDELLKRLDKDPALLAAVANYADHELGLPKDDRLLTNQSGELVGAQCDAAIEDFMSDESYRKAVLDRLTEILKNGERSVDDIKSYGAWMWQQDLDENGVPEVIIRDNPENYVRTAGHELVYTIVIDGKEYKLHLRLECGFQPIMITWWEPPTPPQTPPPPKTTTPKETVPPPPSTTVVTTQGPYKKVEDVVTDPKVPHENGYVDTKPDETIPAESRYIPQQATTNGGKSTETVTETVKPTQPSTQPSTQPAATQPAATQPANVDDKIIPNTEVYIAPQPVTAPADDYVAPKEPTLTDAGPADGMVDIPD